MDGNQTESDVVNDQIDSVATSTDFMQSSLDVVLLISYYC